MTGHKLVRLLSIGVPLLSTLATTVHAQNVVAPSWPPIPPRPQLNQELQLVSQAARVDFTGVVARTRITQTFQNTTNRTIEGTYVFPLPEGAAVSGFAMNVNGKRVEAEILQGDKAREIYTSIVQKMRDPAILEFIDRNLIRARIFPIPPRAEQKVELEYSESLRADSGSFRYVLPLRLPVGGSAEVASVDVHINSPSGIRAVYSPTHNVEVRRDGNTARVTGEFGARYPEPMRPIADRPTPTDRSGSDRDFVLYYTTAKEKVGVNLITYRTGDEDGYLMLLAAPDAAVSQKEIAAKDVIFVFDTSGSMSGEKIEQARKALLTLLGGLNPDDRFNIITFSSDVRTFRDGLTRVNKDTTEAARDFIRGIKAVGGTNINDGLLEALKMLKNEGRPQQIVFMTDGQPTVGETDVAQILKNIRGENAKGKRPADEKEDENLDTKARLFVFGVGFDVNTRLLDTLAEDNRGASDYVLPQEDIEQKVGSLYSKIAYPVLSSPRVDWGGMKVYDVYPKRLPDLFRGTQTVVFGRYAGSNKARVQLIGDSLGHEERIPGQGEFSDEDRLNDMLPRLWAIRKVGYLIDDARRTGRPVDDEVRDEIIKLSKRYGIVTPFTAGLITEDTPGAQPVPMLMGRTDSLGTSIGGIGGGFGGGGFGGGPMRPRARVANEAERAAGLGPQGPAGAPPADYSLQAATANP
ncbi:MAG: VWA domain-containing protein, partial [Armatimonadota bacterium]|nr:VWA domain-containing protein [Armatimonadota bacterium]